MEYFLHRLHQAQILDGAKQKISHSWKGFGILVTAQP